MGRPRTFALTLAALLLLSGCGSSTVTEKSLKKSAETIQSVANEGALLAHGRARESTTETFTREHARELSKQAAGIATRLRSAPADPRVDAKTPVVVETAEATAVQLERLERAGADEARSIELRLDELAERAERLAS